ncbi:hypothetical protein [Salipiger mucosus]|nr:hypothetical protein [Salipiger mucosus]
MDRIDHALGRPLDPTQETDRNGFLTSYEGPEAEELRRSPYWTDGRRWLGDSEAFHVTDCGRAALAAYLEKIGDPHRKFVVTFDGHASDVIATGRSQARYRHFQEVSDAIPISFRDFCQRSSVRVADVREGLRDR